MRETGDLATNAAHHRRRENRNQPNFGEALHTPTTHFRRTTMSGPRNKSRPEHSARPHTFSPGLARLFAGFSRRSVPFARRVSAAGENLRPPRGDVKPNARNHAWRGAIALTCAPVVPMRRPAPARVRPREPEKNGAAAGPSVRPRIRRDPRSHPNPRNHRIPRDRSGRQGRAAAGRMACENPDASEAGSVDQCGSPRHGWRPRAASHTASCWCGDP